MLAASSTPQGIPIRNTQDQLSIRMAEAQARTSSPGGRSRPTGMERRPRQQLLQRQCPIHWQRQPSSGTLSTESNQRQRAILTCSISNVSRIGSSRQPTSRTNRHIQPVLSRCSRRISGSRPHPGRRQSQYSWAHMDPSAHSLAFRGGGMVRRPCQGRRLG